MQPIALFHPFVPEDGIEAVGDVLRSRWIGQGERVREFETAFEDRFGGHAVAVSSGTAALHLAYVLADVRPEHSVVVPAMTCVATAMPLLHMHACMRFADVGPSSLNIDVNDVEALVDDTTRAVVATHYGGTPVDLSALRAIADRVDAVVIADAAQCLLPRRDDFAITDLADLTAFSFQAIKHVTTGDGGMLVCRTPQHAAIARRLRWFGIDRDAKVNNTWDNEITEAGFKYQMTDIDAVLGLSGLVGLDDRLAHRRELLRAYRSGLERAQDVELLDGSFSDANRAPWSVNVRVRDAAALQAHLARNEIESGPVHFRIDRYEVFRPWRRRLPRLDALDNRYLALPLHDRLASPDVLRVVASVAAWANAS